jgi:hypothetical protein
MIPFYRHWGEQIGAMQLQSGLLTDRRRTQFGRILEMIRANYQDLGAGLIGNNPAALDDFMREEKHIHGELAKLSSIR